MSRLDPTGLRLALVAMASIVLFGACVSMLQPVATTRCCSASSYT
jgi:hypothetical protein